MVTWEHSTSLLFRGCVMLAVCCAFYLIWWCTAFRPEKTPHPAAEIILFIGAAASGIGALVWMIRGIRYTEVERKLVPGATILVGGICVYIVLLIATGFFMHRQVTTELILIVGWGVLECMCVNTLYGMGRFSRGMSVAFFLIAVAAAAVSLVCYLEYYQLEKWKAYYDGMIPLVLTGVIMAATAIEIWRGN